MKISIVFVNYNDWHYLDPCLGSIFNVDYPWPFEIIITDNGSENDEVGKIRRKYPKVHVIESSENLGYSGGMNLAIREAKGEYVLVLNGDTLFLDDKMVAAAAYMEEHPNVGMLGPELLNEDRSHQKSTSARNDLRSKFFEIFMDTFYLDRIFKVRESFDVSKSQPVGFILGAAMFVRREVIEKVGVFDERFFFTAEERDWCYRTLLGGYKIIYFPEWKIVHFGGGTGGGLWYMMQHHRATMLYFQKYWKGAGRFSIKLLFMIYNALRILKAGASSLLSPGSEKNAREMSIHLTNLKWHVGIVNTEDIRRTRD